MNIRIHLHQQLKLLLMMLMNSLFTVYYIQKKLFVEVLQRFPLFFEQCTTSNESMSTSWVFYVIYGVHLVFFLFAFVAFIYQNWFREDSKSLILRIKIVSTSYITCYLLFTVFCPLMHVGNYVNFIGFSSQSVYKTLYLFNYSQYM